MAKWAYWWNGTRPATKALQCWCSGSDEFRPKAKGYWKVRMEDGSGKAFRSELLSHSAVLVELVVETC